MINFLRLPEGMWHNEDGIDLAWSFLELYKQLGLKYIVVPAVLTGHRFSIKNQLSET